MPTPEEQAKRQAMDSYNLSVSQLAIGDFPSAESSLREAIRIDPHLVEAHTNLGAFLFRRGDLNAAVDCFQEAVRLRPENPLSHLNLGKTLRGLDRLDEAETSFRKAITLDPSLPPAWNMLGSCLREAGRISEAVAAFAHAISLEPRFREAHSNLCYALYFDPAAHPGLVLEQHQRWAARFAAVQPLQLRVADRALERRLRVGYVSPNFRSHAVGSFVIPIFRYHDRTRFEVIAYSDTTEVDSATDQLRATADVWRDTKSLNDQALAELVRNDRIDILVDLTLHMRGCRLGEFAFRPAPVQLTHLAYCGTGGLSQMDGCMTDIHMMGANAQPYFTEPLLPLPQTYWAYHPPAVAPMPGRLPAERNGYITFGSLNSLAKVNDRVVAAWAKVLNAVPRSRLALFLPGLASSPSLFARFEAGGLSRDRIDAYPRRPYHQYLATYTSIDIALDPFPYNGGTTTLDALWMGAPVVTLAGVLPVGRAGASILMNIGLQSLIADSVDDYVRRTVDLCADMAGLASLRSELRQRMLASPLLDALRYVRDLEGIYRREWDKWLNRQIHLSNP